MNKFLAQFFRDELKNNGYFESIREFAKGKDWQCDVVSPVVDNYDKYGEAFNPYRFMDAVEDYVGSHDVGDKADLYEVIAEMWENDAFEAY